MIYVYLAFILIPLVVVINLRYRAKEYGRINAKFQNGRKARWGE